MQRVSGVGHNQPANMVNFDRAKYETLYKHIIATQENRVLRTCKAQTYSLEMQNSSPATPLAVLVLIFGDIVIDGQDNMVVGESNNSIAIVIFIMHILELYAHFKDSRETQLCDWYANFAALDQDKTAALWSTMLYLTEHLIIDGLNIDNMKLAAKWFSRFYESLVGRYDIQDTLQRKRAKANIKAAAGLKQVVLVLQRKVSIACLPKSDIARAENQQCLLTQAHHQRVFTAPNSHSVSIVKDLSLMDSAAVIKSILMTLCQHDSDPIISLLLQAIHLVPLDGDDELIAKELSKQIAERASQMRPLSAECRGRFKMTAKLWNELQIWLIGVAECIKAMNTELDATLMQLFASLHLAANYIDDALIQFYGIDDFPGKCNIISAKVAALKDLAILQKLSTEQRERIERVTDDVSQLQPTVEKIEKNMRIIHLWRRVINELSELCASENNCHRSVSIVSDAYTNATRALALPEQFNDVMQAQHALLNVVDHITITDTTLIHWAALACRMRALTFDRAVTDVMRSELRALYAVIAIALQDKVLAYQARLKKMTGSPLLSHHLHACQDTADDLPQFVECPVSLEILDDPIISEIDGTSWSSHILSSLNKFPRSPLRIPDEKLKDFKGCLNDKLPTQVLFPHHSLRLLIARFKANDVEGMKSCVMCPLTQTPLLDPMFCKLDHRTYSAKAIRAYLTRHKKTPGDCPVVMDETQTVDDVLFEDFNMKKAVRLLFPELKATDVNAEELLHEGSFEIRRDEISGCCRIL